jgi:hypothetical protein
VAVWAPAAPLHAAHADGPDEPGARPDPDATTRSGVPRSAWILRVNALRRRLGKSHARFAAEDLGATRAGWSHAWSMRRPLSPRQVAHLLALHPELARAYARSRREALASLHPPRTPVRRRGRPPGG